MFSLMVLIVLERVTIMSKLGGRRDIECDNVQGDVELGFYDDECAGGVDVLV